MIGIYKITNQVNGKVYIGQSVHIRTRWKQHKQNAQDKKQNTQLYSAMREYGVDNFSFEVLEECEKEKLNEREIYWISFYNSFQDGYNMTPGGNLPTKINPQEIYDLWDQGYAVKEIKAILKDKMSGSSIESYLQSYENWSVAESRHRGALMAARTKIKSRQKKDCSTIIKQYDIFGNFISNWNSIRQIEKDLKVPRSSISRTLKGETLQAGGFQWKIGLVEDTDNVNNIVDKIKCNFGIIQKDLDGNIINRFKSLKEAAQAVGTNPTNIAKVCKHYNNRRTAKGFIWEYDYDNWIY